MWCKCSFWSTSLKRRSTQQQNFWQQLHVELRVVRLLGAPQCFPAFYSNWSSWPAFGVWSVWTLLGYWSMTGSSRALLRGRGSSSPPQTDRVNAQCGGGGAVGRPAVCVWLIMMLGSIYSIWCGHGNQTLSFFLVAMAMTSWSTLGWFNRPRGPLNTLSALLTRFRLP